MPGPRFPLFSLIAALLLLAARSGVAQGFDPRGAVPPDSLFTDAANRALQPDSLRRRFDEQRVLSRLQAYTRSKTIAGRAISALFNFSQRQEEQAGLDAVLLDREFDKHTFKVVRHINIRTLDAFGYSVRDTLKRPRTFVEHAGNTIHIKTAKSRIRQVLLFRAGQALEPQALAESERLLRQTPEILDARVLVNEVSSTRDSVDIDVVTTDVFSISAGVELGSATTGVTTFGDANFLGLGHQIENTYNYGNDQPQSWTYDGEYTAPFRHFLYGHARYHNEYNYRVAGLGITRDFYSPSTRYAGAFNLTRATQQVAITTPPPGEPYTFVPRTYDAVDMWAGRSLRLRSYDLGYENPGRVILAARALGTAYATPVYPTDQTGVLLLGTVGYSARRYYKDRYLFGFGRTEDVPTGTLLSLTAGFEPNRVGARRYLAARVAGAGFSPRHGYFYAGAELGGYQLLTGDRPWQQGLLGAGTTYFTRLYHAGNWQYRHFLATRATVGLARQPGEYLLGISNDRGLRGFSPASEINPTSRFTVNYETTIFTPVSLLGFRLAVLTFADAAWVTLRPGGGTPFAGDPYTAFGVGLRFRNEYTALRTFQVLFGFYPRGLITPNGVKLFESTRETITFTDFGLGAPGTGMYQ